jgi:hypothetical protein
MGIAIFEGHELLFWGITGFRDQNLKTIEKKIHYRVLRLIHFYRPVALVAEKPSQGRRKNSPWLSSIAAHLMGIALLASLDYRVYSPSTLRTKLCGSHRATRQDMVDHIIKEYPHLVRCATYSSRWQEDYWMPMFIAIAVGMVDTEIRSITSPLPGAECAGLIPYRKKGQT